MWEYASALSAAVAGAAVVCVRHPGTIPLVKSSIAGLFEKKPADTMGGE
jgi:hypothetical protein